MPDSWKTTIVADETGNIAYLRPNNIIGHIKIATADTPDISGKTGIEFPAAIDELTDLLGAVTAFTVPDGTRFLIVTTADLAAGEGIIYYDGDETEGIPFALPASAAAASATIPPFDGGIECNADEGTNVLYLSLDVESVISSLEIWALGVAV